MPDTLFVQVKKDNQMPMESNFKNKNALLVNEDEVYSLIQKL